MLTGSCTKVVALRVLQGAAGASAEFELELWAPPKTKPPELPELDWNDAVEETPVDIIGAVVVAVAGTEDSGAGADTPKMNGDGAVGTILGHPGPALATVEGRDEDDETDAEADAVDGPGPSQAAHLLSLLGLDTLHTLHFHDSAGSVGGTAHAVLDHVPLFGLTLCAVSTASFTALSAAESSSEEESGACSQRTYQSAKSATHK